MEHSVASGSSSTPQHANQYTPCMSSGDVPSSSVEHDTQSIGGYQSTTGAGEFSSHSASCFPQDLHSIPMNYAPRHNVHVGCQASLSPPAMEVKEQKKLSLPTFDPKKMSWQAFSMKLHAALIEQDMEYLLTEPATNCQNHPHSKELMVELYRKLQGSALDLFTSFNAQHFYLSGGRGIEMIKALVHKFHPLDAGAIQAIMSSMQSLQLSDSEDLSIYRDKLENLNLQLSWVGQGMNESYPLHLAQHQLKSSRYGKDIEALQISNTASGTSFSSLQDFFLGLERLDRLRGLPYGGAAVSKPVPKIPKKPTPLGLAASVQDDNNLSANSLMFHAESWVGAINLDEDHVKQLRSLFKCPLCRTNVHMFPSCPLLKNWVIKKKPRSDSPMDSSTSGAARSAVVDSEETCVERSSSPSGGLDSIPEEDFDSNVEFDLLQAIDNQDNESRGAVYPYSDLKVPLGSVRSVFSSSTVLPDHEQSMPSSFDVIIDSFCTRHMMPFHHLFITYKPCEHSFVILADKSRVPCLGIGCISFSLGGKQILLHDVLHVPVLRSPLLSV